MTRGLGIVLEERLSVMQSLLDSEPVHAHQLPFLTLTGSVMEVSGLLHVPLDRMPRDIVVRLVLFLPSGPLLRLWSTGSISMRRLLSQPWATTHLSFDLKRLATERAPLGSTSTFARFPHLQSLELRLKHAEGSTFGLGFKIDWLPPTLTRLVLGWYNCEAELHQFLAKSATTLREATPNLVYLALYSASPHLNEKFLVEDQLPASLSTIILRQNRLMPPHALVSLPPQITRLGLADVRIGTFKGTFSSGLKSLTLYRSDYERPARLASTLFDCLPPNLEELICKIPLAGAQPACLPQTMKRLHLSFARHYTTTTPDQLTTAPWPSSLTDLSVNFQITTITLSTFPSTITRLEATWLDFTAEIIRALPRALRSLKVPTVCKSEPNAFSDNVPLLEDLHLGPSERQPQTILSFVSQLPRSLRSFKLEKPSKLDDTFLADVGHLENLTRLEVTDTQDSNFSMVAVTSLPRSLRFLVLQGVQAWSKNFKHWLRELPPDIERLDLKWKSAPTPNALLLPEELKALLPRVLAFHTISCIPSESVLHFFKAKKAAQQETNSSI